MGPGMLRRLQVLQLKYKHTMANLSGCRFSLQVVWVDLLTRSEFEAGFGSHTPMFTGQTKCVRYSMNFDRAPAKSGVSVTCRTRNSVGLDIGFRQRT